MDTLSAKSTIRGPMIPVITHYRQDLSVDHDSIRVNVEQIIQRGVVTGSGVLLAAGAGGDFPMLSLDERKAVIRTIVETAAGRVPVIAGAQDTNFSNVIALAQHAEQVGAVAIQMSAGYYYESSDEDCQRVFQAVHDATRSLGIMIYNTPWEGYNMTLGQVAKLAELPRCLSLKWSTSESTSVYLRGVRQFSERLAVVDNQDLHVMNHLLGGTGFITHLATVWPEHDLAVWKLLEAGDYHAAQARIAEVNWPWRDFRIKLWKRTGAESPVVKAALEACGRPGGPSRLPTRELTETERSELRSLLQAIGVPDCS